MLGEGQLGTNQLGDSGVTTTSNSFAQVQAFICTEAFQSDTFQQNGFQVVCNTYFSVVSQAQASIQKTTNGYSQSQADVVSTTLQFAQSQVDIKQVYQVFGQANAFIVYTYQVFSQAQGALPPFIYKFAQSQADILAVSINVGQSQSDILATTYVLGQTSGLVDDRMPHAQAMAQIWDRNALAQAQATIIVLGNNGFGQAAGCIGIIKFFTVFYDTFTRNESGTWGTPDIGSAYNIPYIGSSASIDVNGSQGTITVGSGTNSGVDILFGDFKDFELYFEFQFDLFDGYTTSYYEFPNTNYFGGTSAGIYLDFFSNATGVEIGAIFGSEYASYNDSPNTIIDYTVTNAIRFKKDGTNVYFKFWPINSAEPGWLLTLTLTAQEDIDATGPLWFEPWLSSGSSTKVAKYDNISVGANGPFIYNQGYSQANADILVTTYQSAQAQASIFTVWQIGQSNARIYSYDVPQFAQSQAFILKSAGYGQAVGRVEFTIGDYGYVVSKDNAASYWSMSIKADVGADLIDSQQVPPNNLSNFTTYSNIQQGINPIDRISMGFSYFQSYLSTGTLSRFQGSQWSIDGWARFTNGSMRGPVFGFFSNATGSQYLSIGLGGALNGSSGSFIVANHYHTSLAHVFTDSVTRNPLQWYYIALTYNNGTYTVFVDGVQAFQWSVAPLAIWTAFWIENDPLYGAPTADIWLDGIAAYDFVLSQTQITNHFIAGKLQAYGQAMAQIGSFWYAQAAAQIDSPHKQAFAQAQASIRVFNVRAFANANGDILAINRKVAQAKGLITRVGTQAYGQTQGWVSVRTFQSANAQTYLLAYNQPQFGQAQAYIGHFQFGQTQAKINAYDVSRSGQAKALIQPLDGILRWISPNWSSIRGPNLPSYTSPPNQSFTAVFIADETGTWQFKTLIDDFCQVYISGTQIINDTYVTTPKTGSISLTAGQVYTFSIDYQAAGNPNYLNIYYQRPSDSTWWFLTDNKPPWIPIALLQQYSQANARIVGTYYKVGQSQASVKAVVSQYAQAQASIRAQYGLAQAQADISATYRVFGQTNAQIGHLQSGQAQAKLNAYNIPVSGQTLAFIGHFQSAQARTSIKTTYTQFAQTQTFIGHFKLGLALADIKQVYTVFGQAQTYIILSATGQAQGSIKQTYPLMGMDINYALPSLGAEAGDAIDTGTWQLVDGSFASNAIDGSDYGSPWLLPLSAGQFLYVDLGQYRTINFYRIVPVTYDATISLQYSPSANFFDASRFDDWQTLVSGIQFSVDYFASSVDVTDQVLGEISPITARLWRLYVTNSGSYDGVGIATWELGWATVKSPTFAQAQAYLGHAKMGQAMAYISPGVGFQRGQARADIVTTYQLFSQTQAWIIPPTRVGNAVGDILQTYAQHSYPRAWIIPPTVIAQANARIITFNVPHFAQANADIKTTYLKLANAQGFIHKFAGYGLSMAKIFPYYPPKGYGQARAVNGHWQIGYANALIVKIWRFAQALSDIKQDYTKSAQARAFIWQYIQWGQVRADIKQTYSQFAQVNAVLNTGWGLASTRAWIKQTYTPIGQAQLDVKQTYYTPSQALAIIHLTIEVSGQSRAVLTNQKHYSGQAMAWIGYHKFGQTQAQLRAFDVPRFGLTGAYILSSTTIIILPPSSNYHSYLIRYNDHDLPGYAQSEAFDSSMTIATKYAIYVNKSLSEYQGLQNKTISLSMRVWEETYALCKARVLEASTIFRSSRRGFTKLFIQSNDKYYLALAKRLSVQKDVNSSMKILDYTAEFEAKPWLIGVKTYTISIDGAGAVVDDNNNTTPPPPPSTTSKISVGLGMARILGFNTTRIANSQATLIDTRPHGLSQALIRKSVGFGQTQAKIKNSYNKSAQAQARITRKQGYGQARANILTLPGQPTGLVATPGDTTVILTWNPPPYI